MMTHALGPAALLAGSLLLAPLAAAAAQAPDDRPNILFILADDLGWADLDFHGGDVPTPHLDALRAEGVELTNHTVYPVCSPTRAALLSGRYASRFGVTTPTNARAFPWDTLTLPRALKAAGYETALVGKWHLGSTPEWGPNRFGFDHAYGSLAGGVGPWDHRYKRGPYTRTWHRNGELIDEEGHVTDLLADEAVRWLETRGDRPFFLYVPFTAVHLPIREPSAYLDRVPGTIAGPSRREYEACVIHLDDAVGRILEALERSEKADDTLVVFTSDNGGIATAPNDDDLYPPDGYAHGPTAGDNGPLRGQKGMVYEGGIRVVTLVRWPGRIGPGRVDVPVHITDWMPTFCTLAGFEPEGDPRWDGRDIAPALVGGAPLADLPLYTAGTRFRSAALRWGDWKLVLELSGASTGDGRPTVAGVELYNLAEDPGESHDLAVARPEAVDELLALYQELSEADRDAVANDDDPRSCEPYSSSTGGFHGPYVSFTNPSHQAIPASGCSRSMSASTSAIRE